MLKKQARVRRDVMMFSHYLKYETKEKARVMSQRVSHLSSRGVVKL